jgi:hypothetical protein
MSATNEITKVLSMNDTGESNSHQAGICIPKNPPEIIHFFPKLDSSKKNPRAEISIIDERGKSWIFTFIYYNNKKFGGTRDEYRLTGMTGYIRENQIHSGDELSILKDKANNYYIKTKGVQKELHEKNKKTVIVLGNKWRIISI